MTDLITIREAREMMEARCKRSQPSRPIRVPNDDATPEQDAEVAAYEAEQERLEAAAGVYLATDEDWAEYAAWSARNWG